MGATTERRKTVGGFAPDLMEGGPVGFGNLPEDCISHILSFTSPRDTCRLAALGRAFRSAGELDAVWEGFLPSDCRDVLARADEPFEFKSKKELYFRLCKPLLLANGRMSFLLEKSTGKKCYMLSARQLEIVYGERPVNWSWGSHPKSRFPEVATLLNVCLLEMYANINAAILSPKKTYVAYLVYQLSPHVCNSSLPLHNARITIGHYSYINFLRLQPKEHNWAVNKLQNLPDNNMFDLRLLMAKDDGLPDYQEQGTRDDEEYQIYIGRSRNDGWGEVLLGRFTVDEGYAGNVWISVFEMSLHQKKGLIVEGIEVRPVN